jgi:hypothetical protein
MAKNDKTIVQDDVLSETIFEQIDRLMANKLKNDESNNKPIPEEDNNL